MHGNVKDSEEGLWTEYVLKSVSEMARSEGIPFMGNAWT